MGQHTEYEVSPEVVCLIIEPILQFDRVAGVQVNSPVQLMHSVRV